MFLCVVWFVIASCNLYRRMMKQLVMHVQFEYPAILRVLESFHIICLIYLQVLPCAEPPREEADAVGLAVEAMESVSVIICCSVYALGSGAKMQYCMLRNVLCIVFFFAMQGSSSGATSRGCRWRWAQGQAWLLCNSGDVYNMCCMYFECSNRLSLTVIHGLCVVMLCCGRQSEGA